MKGNFKIWTTQLNSHITSAGFATEAVKVQKMHLISSEGFRSSLRPVSRSGLRGCQGLFWSFLLLHLLLRESPSHTFSSQEKISCEPAQPHMMWTMMLFLIMFFCLYFGRWCTPQLWLALWLHFIFFIHYIHLLVKVFNFNILL